MPHLLTKTFKAAVRSKTAPAVLAAEGQATLRKAHIGKAVEAGERTIKFTISTSAVDLDNDTVNQDGWDLSVFLTNPVVLWMHNADQAPVGKCVGIGVEDGALKAVVEFMSPDVPVYGPVSEGVFQMCKAGFLSATSVGFLPISFEVAADRTEEDSWWPAVNFTKQKLLEFSIVTIPANSEALIEPGERQLAPQPADDAVEAAAQAARQAKAELDRVFRNARRYARTL
jgi:HK97 family phage prohead protease